MMSGCLEKRKKMKAEKTFQVEEGIGQKEPEDVKSQADLSLIMKQMGGVIPDLLLQKMVILVSETKFQESDQKGRKNHAGNN